MFDGDDDLRQSQVGHGRRTIRGDAAEQDVAGVAAARGRDEAEHPFIFEELGALLRKALAAAAPGARPSLTARSAGAAPASPPGGGVSLGLELGQFLVGVSTGNRL